jgi:hypothetical protein
MPKPKDTGDAARQARSLLSQAQLDSPDSHFPYKRAVVDELVATDPAMGPDGASDSSVTAQDFMSARISEATEAYVDAQAAYLTDASVTNRELYESATEDLIAARRAHRRYRVDESGRPVMNITARQSGAAPGMTHLRGPRFRRPGEE